MTFALVRTLKRTGCEWTRHFPAASVQPGTQTQRSAPLCANLKIFNFLYELDYSALIQLNLIYRSIKSLKAPVRDFLGCVALGALCWQSRPIKKITFGFVYMPKKYIFSLKNLFKTLWHLPRDRTDIFKFTIKKISVVPLMVFFLYSANNETSLLISVLFFNH